MHSLKITSLLSWATLLVLQIALPWMNDPQGNYWLLLLVLPLLFPIRGLLGDQALHL